MKHLPIFFSILILAGICFLGHLIYGLEKHQRDRSSVPRETATGTSSESEMIVEMLRNGLRINSENTPDVPDADLYGGALTQTAMERFATCPEAAASLKTVFGSYVEKSPMLRYTQWGLFLDALDRSLIYCRNVDTFRNVWHIRRQVVGEQNKAVMEMVKDVESALNDLLKSDQYELSEETREMLDFLLSEIDAMESHASETKKIRELTVTIAKRIDEKFSANLRKLQGDLVTERRKDVDNVEVLEPKKKNGTDDVWEAGTYQRIMDEAKQIFEQQTTTSIVYWLGLSNEKEADTEKQDKTREVYDEARRLQYIRYNLWVIRRLANNTSIDILSRIDAGLLIPSVAAIYRVKEDELMTDDPSHRLFHVRKILLTPKIGLDAF